MPSNRQDTLTA